MTNERRPRLVELGADGRAQRRLAVPVDDNGFGYVEALPGDRFLVAACEAGRVLEIDGDGKVHLDLKVPLVASAVRLPDGNTLVTSLDQRAAIEYDRGGRVVWKLKTAGRPFCARRY
jgi:hypothetical protein